MTHITTSEAPFSVTGKIALVTGAGSGINFTFTELLLSRGCNVILADLSLRPEARDLVSCYDSKDASPRAVFVKTDVTSWPDLARMFDTALNEFGDFDIVCPGAGVYEPPWTSFWLPPGSKESRDEPDSGRYALLDINLTHPIRATQMAISHWMHPQPIQKGRRQGPTAASSNNPKRIIHIASVASQVPVFRAPLYGASKFAISGFVRSLAPLETSCGIRVNAVAPGIVRTPIWTEHPEKLKNLDLSKDAWVTPQEVAEAMLGCIENKSRVGGTIIEVGAGRLREVGVYNDPGPDPLPEAGLMSSNSAAGNEEVKDWLKDRTIWGWPTE
ncbi:Fc.00g054830.m01.CDS01 [Cosmosporella sp. VM-42]